MRRLMPLEFFRHTIMKKGLFLPYNSFLTPINIDKSVFQLHIYPEINVYSHH
jgi:hypothetical protein